MILKIHTDGGAGEDSSYGPCAIGFVVATEDDLYLGSKSQCIVGTNNDAEYLAVSAALDELRAGTILPWGEIKRVEFFSDSQLIVNQIAGEWKCKEDNLKKHLARIQLIRGLLPFGTSFTWIRREFNKDADKLCASAMVDGPKTVFEDPIPRDPRKIKKKEKKRNARRKAAGSKEPDEFGGAVEPREFGVQLGSDLGLSHLL